MPNDITIYEKIDNPIVEAEKMGKMLCDSQMLGIPNPGAGAVVALVCMIEKITPLDFLRTYHVIQGRPSMRSDAMLAQFRKMGGTHEVITRSPEEAAVKLTTKDGQSMEFRFTWGDAQKEDFTVGKDGEVKDNYKYPRKRMQMLWARVISDGVRTLQPEIVSGIYTPEETQDMEPLTVEAKKLPTMADLESQAAEVQTEDAEFEMKEPAKEQPHPDAEPPFVTKAKEEFGATEDVPLANDLQIARWEQLTAELGMSEEAKSIVLDKREVSVFDVLTARQADEIIANLESFKQQSGN